jgi:hypothetical protein
LAEISVVARPLTSTLTRAWRMAERTPSRSSSTSSSLTRALVPSASSTSCDSPRSRSTVRRRGLCAVWSCWVAWATGSAASSAKTSCIVHPRRRAGRGRSRSCLDETRSNRRVDQSDRTSRFRQPDGARRSRSDRPAPDQDDAGTAWALAGESRHRHLPASWGPSESARSDAARPLSPERTSSSGRCRSPRIPVGAQAQPNRLTATATSVRKMRIVTQACVHFGVSFPPASLISVSRAESMASWSGLPGHL